MQRRLFMVLACLFLWACSQPTPDEQQAKVQDLVLPNTNIDISNEAGAQSEVGIAVNPTNALNLVTVANDITNLSRVATWFSTDGGATWTANFIGTTQDGFAAGDTRFDPNVAFDSDGNVYVVYSTTGSLNRILVAKSTDGGQTYSQVTTAVTAGTGGANLHTSMVTTRADTTGPDDILVVYAHVQGNESIEAALSLDGGATFPTTNTAINDSLQRTFLPWAVADAAGNFQVVWEVNQGGGTGVILHDTLNGTTLASGADNTVTTVQITDFAAATSRIPPQPDRGVFSVSTIDVDRTTGRLFVSYTDRTNSSTNDTNIFVRFSDDGTNWSAPTQVNDDGTTTSQFLPRMAVDHTTGVIYLVWYDARNDTANNQQVDLFSSVSIDHGVTWAANQRLTTATSNESTSRAGRDGNNYGEYQGLTVNAGVAHAGWTDGRDANYNSGNNEEVYTTSFTAVDLTNHSPVAKCQNVTVSADGTCHAAVTAAQVNNGSFDPDANDPPPTCTLSPTGPFGLGSTSVTLTCVDPHGATGACTATVTINDTTPPTITAPPNVVVPICNAGLVTIGTATATDNCSASPTVIGQVITKNGVAISPPIAVTNGQVTLDFGTYVVQWTASDGTNTSTTVNQTVTVSPKIQAAGNFLVDDNAFIRDTNGQGGQVLNSGNGQTRLGVASTSASITSVASVQILDRARVTGSIISAGSIAVSSSATVTGTRTQFASVVLPQLPALPAFPPPVGGNITINNGTQTLTPGSYPTVTVNSGGTLILTGGDFFFQNFFINSSVNVRVQVNPNTRVFIQNQFAFRSPFVNASGTLQPILLGYAGSNLVVETTFGGTLVAPNATVTFGIGSGVNYQGSFYAKNIEVRPASALICDEGFTPPLPITSPASCSDGVKDGSETDVDCGGLACAPCANGHICSANSDCQSGDCFGGVCQQPAGPVAATLSKFADWGSGYCVNIQVTNLSPQPTTNWTVTINTGLSTTYTNWNGNFSGTTGTITVTPGFSWNQVIAPGATNQTVGFCANRTPANSGAIPVIVSTSGSF